jgi:hypothetical protein
MEGLRDDSSPNAAANDPRQASSPPSSDPLLKSAMSEDDAERLESRFWRRSGRAGSLVEEWREAQLVMPLRRLWWWW